MNLVAESESEDPHGIIREEAFELNKLAFACVRLRGNQPLESRALNRISAVNTVFGHHPRP